MSQRKLDTESAVDISTLPDRHPFRWLRWLIVSVLFVAILALFFHLTFVAVLPIEQSLGSERSPDGTLVAEYSWRPLGAAGIITRNPMLYLTIRDARTGAVVTRHDFWGDVPTLNEAKERFDGKLPWQPSQEP